MAELLQDGEGNASSKRLAAYVFGVVSIVLAVSALFSEANVAVAMTEIVKMFLVACVTLLVGGTAAEQIGKIGK